MLVASIVATSLTALAQCPNNEIWYTTRDGKKAELYVGFYLDWSNPNLKIVSHTYANGKGVIRANGPIKYYGYFEPDGGGFMLSLNVDTITFPDCLEGIISNYFINIKTFKGKLASADGRCLIKNGELIAFAPEGLTEYTIPNGVTKIGNYAFFFCENLTSITIPNSVTTIEEGAFKGCDNLKTFKGELASADGRCLIKNGELIAFAPGGPTEYTIPSGITKIGDYAFQDCNNLTSITIPYGVTTIGEGAFSRCSNLRSITIPNSVTTIEEGAFFYCGLTSITIPSSVTKIGPCAFECCDNLTSINIPNGVREIKCSTFASCTNLRSVTISNSVTRIGAGAFSYCTNLTNVNIPSSVTKIGPHAFEGCNVSYQIKALAERLLYEDPDEIWGTWDGDL